jgi:hypothetical protein
LEIRVIGHDNSNKPSADNRRGLGFRKMNNFMQAKTVYAECIYNTEKLP